MSTYTNPSGISNSGNYLNFTNQRAQIYLKNLNIVNDANNYNNFLVEQFNQNYSGTTNNSNSYPDNDFRNILAEQRRNSTVLSFT